jgi:hypothetical protein
MKDSLVQTLPQNLSESMGWIILLIVWVIERISVCLTRTAEAMNCLISKNAGEKTAAGEAPPTVAARVFFSKGNPCGVPAILKLEWSPATMRAPFRSWDFRETALSGHQRALWPAGSFPGG